MWLQDPRGSNALPGLYCESWKGFPGQAQGKGTEAGEHMPGPYSLAPALSSICMSRAHLLAPTWLPPKSLTANTSIHSQTQAPPPNLGPSPVSANGTPSLEFLPTPHHSSALQYPSAPRSCQVYLPALPSVLTRPLCTATAWLTKPASLAWTF